MERTHSERVSEYESMTEAERREKVEKALETASWAEENGQNDLRDVMLARLSAMDEVVGGDATEVLN